MNAVGINTSAARIMHVDLNSCFASCTQQAYATLRGKPIAVAAYETPKAIILAPSIEAKRYGIVTGMSVADARKIYPSLIIRSPDVSLIRDVHEQFKVICEKYSPQVEPKSIDEFVIDFSSMPLVTLADMVIIGRDIKKELSHIGEALLCNVGIATNRCLAKTAAGMKKPDGLTIITHKNLLHILSSLTLIDLPGINTRYQSRLFAQGIANPLDFFYATSSKLRHSVFQSVVGTYWYMRLRGWEVDAGVFKRKTFGQQYALGEKTDDIYKLLKLLYKLCEKMGRRLRKHSHEAYGIHVGCAHTDNQYWHKGVHVSQALYTTKELFIAAKRVLLLRPSYGEVSRLSVRCYDLRTRIYVQDYLFEKDSKHVALSNALDKLNDRYGEYTVISGLMMDMDKTILDRIAFGKSGVSS